MNKKFICLIFAVAVVSSVTTLGGTFMFNKSHAQNVTKSSGGCPIPELLNEKESRPVYNVISPVGEATIKQIKQAPRLSSLNGKTIAVVGGSFMANVTHPEIKRLISEHYPDAKVILLNEIGSAGPYPAPGVKRQQKDEFERKLKEMNVDAVISGNGGCGLCTPKEEGSCITAEYLGIPSVMIAAQGFAEQAKTTAFNSGVTVQRVAEYPGAFSSHTHDELIKNTREILWKQIVEGLTKPLTQEEIDFTVKNFNKDKKDTVFSGTLEEVQQYFENRGWTDGLPIIPPTEEAVSEFLKYTPYTRDSVIGIIPPSYKKVTAEHVAAVGAMAGCKPEYMPILVAFAKAMMNGDFRKTLSSTHAWTPYLWINGPIARQLGIEAGQGEISSPENKKIGRFIDLAMINLGGYDIKKNRMGTFGYISSWAMAEDEEALARIGWQPYHVQNGFNYCDNTVTATSALNWGNNLTPATSNAEKILELMAWDTVEKEQFALGSGTPFVYRTIFITEFVARDLAKKFKNKNQLENALIKTARRPLEERSYANFYANPGSSFDGKNYSLEQHMNKTAHRENAQITATPKWLFWTDKTEMMTVPVIAEGKTAIVVTGDKNRNKVLTVPGGGITTVKIELPDNWDTLTKDLGYKPLSNYYLKSTSHVNLMNNETSSETTAAAVQGYKPNSNPAKIKRPSAEQYRKLRQQHSEQNNSSDNYRKKRSDNRQYGNSDLNTQKRPSPEQYRKIREERGQSSGSVYGSSSEYTQRRPSPEQYRKMRQQRQTSE